jgi:hypothetical protein
MVGRAMNIPRTYSSKWLGAGVTVRTSELGHRLGELYESFPVGSLEHAPLSLYLIVRLSQGNKIPFAAVLGSRITAETRLERAIMGCAVLILTGAIIDRS